jgi:phage terminase Nu1 subunit (DNA packaging protein)
MEVERKRGMLLEREAVLATWSNIFRMVRARVLAVVSRVRARLPHLTAQDAQLIDEELRAALTELGEDRATPLP